MNPLVKLLLLLLRNMKHVLLYFVIALFFSCDYAKGVSKDVQKQILSHKKFIRSITFTGLVSDLKYCNDCNYNKYQVIINQKELSAMDIKLGNRSYPPYYEITSDNKLHFSVNEKLYNEIRKGFEVMKKSNSDNIFINGVSYELLSKTQYEWIP